MEKDKMTIEKLGIMVAEGFENIEERFDKVEQTLKSHGSAIEALDGKVEDLNKRFKKVEEIVEPILMGYGVIKEVVSQLNRRVDKLEKHTGLTS